MGFWNEYRESVFDVPPLGAPGSASTPSSGGGGGGNPTTSGAPTVGATPKVADRSVKEAFIIGLEPNDLQHYWLAGLISDQEVAALKGQATLESLKNMTRTAADLKAAGDLSSNPPSVITNEFTNYGASGRPGAMGDSNFNWAPAPGQEGQPNAAGGFTPSTAPGGSRAVAPGAVPNTASGGSSRPASGGGGGSAPAAAPSVPAVPPPPAANTPADFAQRGGMVVPGQSGRILLNGQQNINFNAAPQQGPDGLWYNSPNTPGFKSETAARMAQTYSNAGPALTSRLGNSPTAKASQNGGFAKTFAPGESNFNTVGLDESIAAGATKGSQPGDILGTISNNSGRFLDITQGGISEGGGLTPVGNNESFTGQIPGGPSVGMSSILGNGGVNTQYWLSQMSGLPPSEAAKLNINTPEKALQFQQAVETSRANGTLPNFASLYALNEPSGYQGAAGGPELKWGSANGGASNTPYDQAFNPWVENALGSPDLTYFPDVTVAPGQSGGQQPNNWWLDDPSLMARGGQFSTNGPLAMVDMSTGRTEAIAGEAGPEKITVDPMRDVKKQGESWGAGHRPKMMAAGGQIYSGVGKGGFGTPAPLYDENGYITDEGARLGYRSQPSEGPGGTAVTDANGGQRAFMAPDYSKSGQPIQASFETMSPAAQEQFTNQGNRAPNAQVSGNLMPSSEQYFSGGRYYPVYTEANPANYSQSLGAATGYDYVPYNTAGVPGFVKVPKYDVPKLVGHDQIKPGKIAYLTDLLSNNGNGTDGAGIHMSGINSREAALSALYDLDPKAALMFAGQGGGNGTWGSGNSGQGGGGWGRGYGGSGDIEREAARRRQYDIQSRNYARAGMPSPTLLDIPRQTWEGEGDPPWGSGEAPYERYNRPVQNGYALPFDYDVQSPWYDRGNLNGGGDWGMGYNGRGGRGGGRNWDQGGSQGGQGGGHGGGGQQSGQGGHGGGGGQHGSGDWGAPNRPGNQGAEQWFNQLPWWARNARRFGPPLGSGMVTA